MKCVRNAKSLPRGKRTLERPEEGCACRPYRDHTRRDSRGREAGLGFDWPTQPHRHFERVHQHSVERHWVGALFVVGAVLGVGFAVLDSHVSDTTTAGEMLRGAFVRVPARGHPDDHPDSALRESGDVGILARRSGHLHRLRRRDGDRLRADEARSTSPDGTFGQRFSREDGLVPGLARIEAAAGQHSPYGLDPESGRGEKAP